MTIQARFHSAGSGFATRPAAISFAGKETSKPEATQSEAAATSSRPRKKPGLAALVSGILLSGLALLSGCKSNNSNVVNTEPADGRAPVTRQIESSHVSSEDDDSRAGNIGISTSGKPGINIGGRLMIDSDGNIGIDLLGQ